MNLYPIEFIDKDSSLQTGLTNDESWNKKGTWVWYAGKREFINIQRIIKSNRVLNIIYPQKEKISKSEKGNF